MADDDRAHDGIATRWAIGTLAVFALASLTGFLLLPVPQGATLYDRFCTALGLPSGPPPAAGAATGVKPQPPVFAWTADRLDYVASGNAAGAKDVVATCNGCHGENGIGLSDAFPNLAGHPADGTVKQLADYRSGRRQHPLMSPMAAPLTEKQVTDLAAHYASLAPPPVAPASAMPRLASVGDPLRNIAPCGACHGTFARKEGAPPLGGQKQAYLVAQLQAFANGSRANDINAQMRVVARALTQQEMDELAAWYAGPAAQR